MSAPRHDVILVGAGPAGAHLALRLAREGFAVLLLDRHGFPRPKPCGEFMSPECLPMLAELGLGETLHAAGARSVHGMTLYGYGVRANGSYRAVGATVVPGGHGHAIRREVLDQQAAQAACRAGVELRTGLRVGGLLRAPDGRVLGVQARTQDGQELELRARLTVGADGIHSAVATALGVRREVPWLRRVALVTRYTGVPLRDHAEAHLFPGGYFAATAVDQDLFTVNLVVDVAAVRERQGSLDEFFAQCLTQAPELAERLRHARRAEPLRGVGPLACTTTDQIAAGAALVGDACGYVDPITGEGMYLAMRGAQILAPRLATALHHPAAEGRALRAYRRERAAEFGPRMFLARLLQRGLRHPAVVRLCLQLLAARPRILEVLVAVTGDYVRPRELLRPGLWWRALRAAAL